jgi:hypothetical protein
MFFLSPSCRASQRKGVDRRPRRRAALEGTGAKARELTVKLQGRNFRLTDVAGDVIHKLIA